MVVGWFLAVRSIMAARQGIVHGLTLLARAWLAALFSFVLVRLVLPNPTVALLIAAFAGAATILLSPKRTRHIPASVRRQVIAEYEAKKDQKYDPTEHHIDHIWPFALGGSHTVDNLRVVPSRRNLRKGRKIPRLQDWI